MSRIPRMIGPSELAPWPLDHDQTGKGQSKNEGAPAEHKKRQPKDGTYSEQTASECKRIVDIIPLGSGKELVVQTPCRPVDTVEPDRPKINLLNPDRPKSSGNTEATHLPSNTKIK